MKKTSKLKIPLNKMKLLKKNNILLTKIFEQIL